MCYQKEIIFDKVAQFNKSKTVGSVWDGNTLVVHLKTQLSKPEQEEPDLSVPSLLVSVKIWSGSIRTNANS